MRPPASRRSRNRTPDPTPRMLCKMIKSSGETNIVIPGPSLPLSRVLGVLAPALILLVVIPAIVRGCTSNLGSAGGQLAFLILTIMLGIPAIFGGVNLRVGGRRRRTTVKASPAGLAMERRSAWRTRTKVVSASEILDVDQSTFEGALEPTS